MIVCNLIIRISWRGLRLFDYAPRIHETSWRIGPLVITRLHPRF